MRNTYTILVRNFLRVFHDLSIKIVYYFLSKLSQVRKCAANPDLRYVVVYPFSVYRYFKL